MIQQTSVLKFSFGKRLIKDSFWIINWFCTFRFCKQGTSPSLVGFRYSGISVGAVLCPESLSFVDTNRYPSNTSVLPSVYSLRRLRITSFGWIRLCWSLHFMMSLVKISYIIKVLLNSRQQSIFLQFFHQRVILFASTDLIGPIVLNVKTEFYCLFWISWEKRLKFLGKIVTDFQLWIKYSNYVVMLRGGEGGGRTKVVNSESRINNFSFWLGLE